MANGVGSSPSRPLCVRRIATRERLSCCLSWAQVFCERGHLNKHARRHRYVILMMVNDGKIRTKREQRGEVIRRV